MRGRRKGALRVGQTSEKNAQKPVVRNAPPEVHLPSSCLLLTCCHIALIAACAHALVFHSICCSLCNLGKVRLPSSSSTSNYHHASDRDARGPRDINGGSGGGGASAAAPNGSDGTTTRPAGSGGVVGKAALPPAPAGSLAAVAAAAAAGSNGSLRSLGQQMAQGGGGGGKGGRGADGSPLTQGVKAHAVMLSTSSLSVNQM